MGLGDAATPRNSRGGLRINDPNLHPMNSVPNNDNPVDPGAERHSEKRKRGGPRRRGGARRAGKPRPKPGAQCKGRKQPMTRRRKPDAPKEAPGRREPEEILPALPGSQVHRFILRQLSAFSKHGIRSNAILQLAGHQPPRFNGRELKLSRAALTLLFFLAGWAEERPGDFISSATILNSIARRHRVLGELEMSWSATTTTTVYSAISDLRAAISSRQLDENIIEAIPHVGYRLAIPAINILADPAAEHILARLALGRFDRGGGESA